MSDPMLALQFPLNFQQFRFEQRTPLLAPNTFPDDDVDLPALILERQKGHTLGALRTLPHEHNSGGTNDLSMCNAAKIPRRQYSTPGPSIAHQSHGMPPHC